ncbi:flagellar motor switch protein FliN [Rhizobium sp. 32-5/1]|uniref:flagellar motor switch protein FliN n=1 Tax=Rhizobium sp. 32-5/1 TaxID=3019602 RepID=UPI00240E818B|nr:flagellar motor switch protein FliN [Rhizobium sp. 32-5/1]WEZ84424.1 flagellar motor switch protein FliN [Rhizobium sp. 32-5/1]
MDFGAAETPDLSSDFGSSFGDTAGGLDSFGGDFGSTDFGDDAVSGTAFGTSDFDGSSDFGGAHLDGSSTSSEPGSSLTANLDLIMDIPIEVQIVLGSSRMQVSSLMNLTEGATIALDRRIGEAVDIVVNGRVIGRGEITVLEDDETRFGVKLIEIKGTSKV